MIGVQAGDGQSAARARIHCTVHYSTKMTPQQRQIRPNLRSRAAHSSGWVKPHGKQHAAPNRAFRARSHSRHTTTAGLRAQRE